MYFLNRHYFNVIFVEMLESIVKQEVLCILDFVLSGEVPRLSPSIYSIWSITEQLGQFILSKPYNKLHLKHFRNLEERKKQQKECMYMSDTLPRKKTSPSVSPHFSSATLGRSIASKVSSCILLTAF